MMPHTDSAPRSRQLWRGLIVLIALGVAFWAYSSWRTPGSSGDKKRAEAISVVSALVSEQPLPIKLTASAKVEAVQAVDVRAQISATIAKVHVREGQSVKAGDLLFTLDVRNETATLAKAQAQLAKSRAELANVARTLQRQRDLLAKNFIAQSALDAALSLMESGQAQVAADEAAVQAARVALSYGTIRAPIAGRTGAIAVFPGTLVQPSGPLLVSISQNDPALLSFTLPERDLAAVRSAKLAGTVSVTAQAQSGQSLTGELSFIDNSIDAASGTVRLKARFSNADSALWPGMFVPVHLAPQVIERALTVPTHAVQSGPDERFVYVIGSDGTVASQRVTVRHTQDGISVIEGVAAGTKVVAEGAQNLRPGSSVIESSTRTAAQP
jgi:RND family efflux transporter MFP subunit